MTGKMPSKTPRFRLAVAPFFNHNGVKKDVYKRQVFQESGNVGVEVKVVVSIIGIAPEHIGVLRRLHLKTCLLYTSLGSVGRHQPLYLHGAARREHHARLDE